MVVNDDPSRAKTKGRHVFFREAFLKKNCLGMGLYESFMILASLKKRGYLQSGPLLVIDGVIFPTSGVMSLLTAGFQGPLCRIHHFFPS